MVRARRALDPKVGGMGSEAGEGLCKSSRDGLLMIGRIEISSGGHRERSRKCCQDLDLKPGSGSYKVQWMSGIAKGLVLALVTFGTPTYAADGLTSGHYLFAWAGDVSPKGSDFLAITDADPESASYGHLVATAVSDQVSMQVHYTG
jgi:hypothetical protein